MQCVCCLGDISCCEHDINLVKLERWKNIRTAYVRLLKLPKSGASQNLTECLAFLQPYLKGEDMSGNLDVEDTATEESNTNQNDGSETLVEREMP